jgi:hypothetical protein
MFQNGSHAPMGKNKLISIGEKKLEKGKEKRERDVEEKQETGQDESKMESVRVKYRPKAKRVREQEILAHCERE